MIRLFIEFKYIHLEERSYLFDLLKPFVGKEYTYDDESRMTEYCVSKNDFEIVESPELADIAVLPMSWNYYYEKHKIIEANEIISNAIKHGLKVISQTTGDFGITPKYNSEVFVFRQSGYNTCVPKNHLGAPVFIPDPLKTHFMGDVNKILNYNVNNKRNFCIGFCGHANDNYLIHIKEFALVCLRNFLSIIRVSSFDKQKVISSSYLRTKLLNLVELNNNLNVNFIKRKKYRAKDVIQSNSREITTNEYFNNILESDFVLCPRGLGNFSVRFYETIAMGRIPNVLDTDSIFPRLKHLRWSDHCIIINFSEVNRLHEIILDFLQNRSMESVRKSNRELFLNGLMRKGFWVNNIELILNEKYLIE